MNISFATRPSALARWQTQWVIQLLQSKWPGLQCQEVMIQTQGDRILDRPLPEIGGKGLFTQELEAELQHGRVQAAVHSLKDLPVEEPPDLAVGAVPARAEARDALVSAQGYRLSELPDGARVGTSSLRRSAQLLSVRPDLRIEPLRGNIDTRLRKALEGQYEAIVLAGAGLARLGMEKWISDWLPFEVMLPAPGQGALAVQCRASDADTLRLLAEIEDQRARLAVAAERAFLTGLGGGCSLPIAAYATAQVANDHAIIDMTGLVASPDGKRFLRLQGTGDEPLSLGMSLAQEALGQGASEILAMTA